MNSLKDKLNQDARMALQFSYSPYSQKKIGASLVLTNGKTYSGCNIENASYGGTVCAERVAIWKAFSENESSEKITEIVVASDETEPWPPCGFCRQVIAEFATPETLIRLVNLEQKEVSYKFKDLFPEAFKPEHLLKK
ncbi:MAG: cytidine deaminase [Bdellovibrio sp.]|nr:cytidine deaminase [Bdellovibrio sp.]